MERTDKRDYNAPRLTEYGTVENLTRGTGFTNLDFLFNKNDADGNPWNVGGGGSGHTST